MSVADNGETLLRACVSGQRILWKKDAQFPAFVHDVACLPDDESMDNIEICLNDTHLDQVCPRWTYLLDDEIPLVLKCGESYVLTSTRALMQDKNRYKVIDDEEVPRDVFVESFQSLSKEDHSYMVVEDVMDPRLAYLRTEQQDDVYPIRIGAKDRLLDCKEAILFLVEGQDVRGCVPRLRSKLRDGLGAEFADLVSRQGEDSYQLLPKGKACFAETMCCMLHESGLFNDQAYCNALPKTTLMKRTPKPLIERVRNMYKEVVETKQKKTTTVGHYMEIDMECIDAQASAYTMTLRVGEYTKDVPFGEDDSDYWLVQRAHFFFEKYAGPLRKDGMACLNIVHMFKGGGMLATDGYIYGLGDGDDLLCDERLSPEKNDERNTKIALPALNHYVTSCLQWHFPNGSLYDAAKLATAADVVAQAQLKYDELKEELATIKREEASLTKRKRRLEDDIRTMCRSAGATSA